MEQPFRWIRVIFRQILYIADVMGKSTQLVVRKENQAEGECSRIFIPQDDED